MSLVKSNRMMLIYAYGIEFLLAGLIYAALWQRDWLYSVTKFVDDSAASWATFFGVMLAGAMAARLVFFSLNSGDFSAWLEWKKVGGVFSGAFLFNLLLFLSATTISAVLIYVKGTWLTEFGVIAGILGLINSVTFALLVHRLGRLQAKFNYEFRKAMHVEHRQ